MPRKLKEDPPWFHPKLEDVIVDPRGIFTKLHSTQVEMLRRKLVGNQYHSRPRGKKKWQEIVPLDGAKYALDCHPDDEGKIIITGARKTQKSGL